MPRIYDKDGVVFLEGGSFDLKIDGSRKIYVKKKSQNSYSYINNVSPEGLSLDDKKRFLDQLNRMIEAKIRESE